VGKELCVWLTRSPVRFHDPGACSGIDYQRETSGQELFKRGGLPCVGQLRRVIFQTNLALANSFSKHFLLMAKISCPIIYPSEKIGIHACFLRWRFILALFFPILFLFDTSLKTRRVYIFSWCILLCI
jgi:hypothetical protein